MEKLHIYQITKPERTQYYPATVIKIGGASQNEAGLRDIAHLARLGRLPIIVHGGGPQIDAELKNRGIVPQKHNGVRITDAATLSVVNDVLTDINTDIVKQLESLGIKAKGYTVDSGLLHAKIDNPDLGFVGGIPTVDINSLLEDVAQGIVPVIAPLAINANGEGILNVNGDTVAGAVAAGLRSNLALVTDVLGVLDPTQTLVSELNKDMYEKMVTDKHITTGMRPKIDAAFKAKLAGGSALICGSDQIIQAVLGKPHATRIVADIFDLSSKKEIPNKKRGEIYLGSEIEEELEHDHRLSIARQIENRLKELDDKMVFVDAATILTEMNKDNAVLSLGENGELLGCAFISQSTSDPSTMEIKTWLNFRNDNYESSGLIVMLNAAQWARTFPGIKRVLTRVKATNKRAQEGLGELRSPYIKTEVSERSGNIVFVYNLTELGKDPYETGD